MTRHWLILPLPYNPENNIRIRKQYYRGTLFHLSKNQTITTKKEEELTFTIHISESAQRCRHGTHPTCPQQLSTPHCIWPCSFFTFAQPSPTHCSPTLSFTWKFLTHLKNLKDLILPHSSFPIDLMS